MIIINTKAVATIIQAVSPLFGTGAGAAAGSAALAGSVAAVAATAGAAAGASTLAGSAGAAALCARAPVKLNARQAAANKEARYFFMGFLISSESILTGFTGADTDNLLQVINEDLAVTNLAGTGSSFYGFNRTIDQRIVYRRFDFYLG